MFNFFKKKSTKNSNVGSDKFALAAITYYINQDNKPIIDIALNDYDDISVDALNKLLDILSNDGFFVETINMIKQGLIEDGREDIILTILTKLGQKIANKLNNKDDAGDGPCIRPSDML